MVLEVFGHQKMVGKMRVLMTMALLSLKGASGMVVSRLDVYDMAGGVDALPLCEGLEEVSYVYLPDGFGPENVTFVAVMSGDMPARVELFLACDEGSRFSQIEGVKPFAYSGDNDRSGTFLPYGNVPPPAFGSCTLESRVLPAPSNDAFEVSASFMILEGDVKSVTCSATAPSPEPTSVPTFAPTPTFEPSSGPTTLPTPSPSLLPTSGPTTTMVPTSRPTEARDNKGSDFVLAFLENIRVGLLELHITSETSGSGTVEGRSFTRTFDVEADAVTTVKIPNRIRSFKRDGFDDDAGFRVRSDVDIVVYGSNEGTRLDGETNSMDAFLALPTDVLGKEYAVLSYETHSNPIRGDVPRSQFAVVATEDDTVVEITPSFTFGRRVEGEAFNVTLKALEAFQLQCDTDVTGTLVKASSAVAVFAGAECAQIPLGYACDAVVEQLPPTSAFGTTFMTMELNETAQADVFRVLAKDDNTVVTVDGKEKAILNASTFYETILSGAHYIETSGPSLMAQYNQGRFGQNPYMLLLPHAGQFLSKYSLTVLFDDNFVNVVVRSGDFNDCTVDNDAMTATKVINITDTDYLGASLALAPGTHDLLCPSPFGATVYGQRTSLSAYGYPAGMAFGSSP